MPQVSVVHWTTCRRVRWQAKGQARPFLPAKVGSSQTGLREELGKEAEKSTGIARTPAFGADVPGDQLSSVTRVKAFALSRQHDDLALHLVMSRSAYVVALELVRARGAGGQRDLSRVATLERIAMECQALA
jgi:hypothetical protein